MKALLLLTALIVSALPVKAADDIEVKKAYWYGVVYGSGATLCGAVIDEQITKKYAQYFLPEFIKEVSKYPESKDIIPTLKKSQNAVMKDDNCKGVFE